MAAIFIAAAYVIMLLISWIFHVSSDRYCDGVWAVGEGGIEKATCLPKYEAIKEQVEYPTIEECNLYTGFEAEICFGDYEFNKNANKNLLENVCSETENTGS